MRELVRDALEKVGNIFGNNSEKCTCMACDAIDWMEKTFDCAVGTEGPEYKRASKFVGLSVNDQEDLISLLAITNSKMREIKPKLKSVSETYMKLYMIREICMEKLKEGI